MPILELDRIVVSVDDMKHYLRVTGDLDNDLVLELLNAAKEEADNYMQNDFKKLDEETGELVLLPIPFSVTRAIKSLVAYWYFNREDFIANENSGMVNKSKSKDVPMNFYSSLWSHRKEPWL
jgi:hypothetical protein